MDRSTAEILSDLTGDFYECYAEEFAATRQSPWPGWQRCLDEMGLGAGVQRPTAHLGTSAAAPLTVLDVGCGNLRFLKYLISKLPQEMQVESFAVDNCEGLLPDEEVLANEYPFVRFQKLDVVARAIHEASLPQALEAPRCQVVVCFGLMHHTPGAQYRKRLLADLVRCAQGGGFVAVSFWQFMESPDLAERALDAHARGLVRTGIDPARLDEGDYLLGWQNADDAFRYCHHFTDAEIDDLVASLGSAATVKARFKADGRTHGLNSYLVLRARG